MQAALNWVGDKAFAYTSHSGFTGMVDAAAKTSADAQGPSPMELLLCGLGGCTSYDVVSILQKARQDIVGCETKISAQRVDAVPAVFDEIHIHFRVTGNNLNEKQVARAVALSADKYCSASIMLTRGGVKITHDFSLIEQAVNAD